MSNTKNFIITESKKGDVIVQTKTYDWKMEFGSVSNHGQILNHFIANLPEEDINGLLTDIYIASTSMLVDVKFHKYIMDYLKERIQEAEILEEVTEEQEKENLKIVKDGLQDT